MTIPHMLIQLILPIATLILTPIDRALIHPSSLMFPSMTFEITLSRERLVAGEAGRLGWNNTLGSHQRSIQVVVGSMSQQRCTNVGDSGFKAWRG
jgi:hypothetical protein